MGRPRKRRREDDGAPTIDLSDSTGYGVTATGEASAPAQMSEMTLSQYPAENLGFDDLPLDYLGDLNNGPLAGSLFQNPDDVLGGGGLGSFPDDGQLGYGTTTAPDVEALGSTLNPQLMSPLTKSSSTNGGQGEQVSSGSGCSCLSNLYATLSSFQSLPPPSFPYSMSTLHKATIAAQEACRCELCPRQFNSALQNTMLLSTLLPLISYEYAKLLSHVDDRASRDESFVLRMGEKDRSLEDMLKHTGLVDCPMSFDLDLTPEEWRSMARKAIRRKVMGSSSTDISVLGVVNSLESRQKFWHERPILAEFQRGRSCREHGSEVGEEHTCLKMLARVKVSIEELNLC